MTAAMVGIPITTVLMLALAFMPASLLLDIYRNPTGTLTDSILTGILLALLVTLFAAYLLIITLLLV